jgi:hypothetical protein
VYEIGSGVPKVLESHPKMCMFLESKDEAIDNLFPICPKIGIYKMPN